MSQLAHIEEAVKYYIETPTSFALLITGKWGSGKTYYYDNFISPAAAAITIPNSPLKYLPIRISLYGINSIDEFESALVAEIYPIVKSSAAQTGLKLSRSLIRGFIKNKTDVDINDFIPDKLNPDSKDILDKSRLLICIDDLERKGDNLSYKQIIGYINSLVESNNTKVIILANENTMDGEYKLFKEKTIGITIVFDQNLDILFANIINKFNSINIKYKEFLEENKNLILDVIISADKNLRLIINSIDRFESVFNAFELSKFSSESSILKLLLRFTFGLNIDFLSGKIDNDQKSLLDTVSNNLNGIDWNEVLNSMGRKRDDEREATYKELFEERYFKSSKYLYLESIFDYITKYSPLDTNKLLIEIEKLFPNDEDISDQILTYRKLSNTNVGKLSEKEYRELTYKLIKYSESGYYILTDLLSVPYFAMRFNNPLGFKIENITKKIIKGIKKRRKTDLYESVLHHQVGSISTKYPYYAYMKQIGEEAIKVNNLINSRTEEIYSINIINKIETDFDEFIRIISSDREALYKPILSKGNPNLIYKIIKHKLNNEQIEILSYTIEDRHKHTDMNKEEIPFLIKLRDLLESHLSKAKNTVNKFYINTLFESLKKSIPLYDSKTGELIQY